MKVFLSSTYKKIFIIILFFLTIIILGFLIYKFFFSQLIISNPDNQATSTKSNSSNTGNLPSINNTNKNIIDKKDNTGLPTDNTKKITNKNDSTDKTTKNDKIKTIVNTPSKNLTLSSDGKKIQFYNTDDNKFYKVDENGNISLLSNKQFYNVEKVTWSTQNNKAILEYPDGSNIIYDFNNNVQITLPKHWEDFSFSPKGESITGKSIGLDPQNRWLITASSDGSKVKPIDEIGNNSKNIFSSWSPNNKSIALQVEGVGFNRQKIYFIGTKNENFKSTTIEGRGFEFIWSPNGEKLLYSVYSSDTNMNPTLWIVNANGDDIGKNRKNLNIMTWAHKCAFASNNEIYCAIPTNLEEGSGIFPEFAEKSNDKLYKINVISKHKEYIITPQNNINISNIIISDNQKYLYFTDAPTKKIHQINLK